eukprot:97484-Pyramimonas_sp.AAC.1
MCHGCVGWNCSEPVLNIVRSFEGRCLNTVRGLHRKETETGKEFRDRSANRSREMFKEGGFKTLVEKAVRYNFDFAVEVSQCKCHMPPTVYSKLWQQTLRSMLHVSGEWT